jgi:hypothetical protein
MVDEVTSSRLHTLLREVPDVVVWWGSAVECASALSRRESEGSLTTGEVQQGFRFLAEAERSWKEISPSDQLRNLAIRLLRAHQLRGGDALQLAAAIMASENRPETLEVVTLDDWLALAASREGFTVLPR